jgi:hypothetical protein
VLPRHLKRIYDPPTQDLSRLARQLPSESVSWIRGWFHGLAERDLEMLDSKDQHPSEFMKRCLTVRQGTKIATVLATEFVEHLPIRNTP